MKEGMNHSGQLKPLQTSSVLPACVILPPMMQFTISQKEIVEEWKQHKVEILGSL